MNKESSDLTEGSIWKKVLLFSLPLMLSNLLQVLFNMSDIAVVGQFAGSTALGAVGSTTTLVAMYTTFLIGLGSGVNVLVARYFGSKKEKELSETIHTSLILCVIVGIVVFLIGELLTVPILELLHTKEELLSGAVLYLRIYFLGMPAVAIYNFGNAVYSAVGNTKKPLAFLSASGVINVLLNLLLVIGFHLDVAGVAIASVVSQYISGILLLLTLLRSSALYSLSLERMVLKADKAKMILSLGLSSGIQNAIFQLANLFIQGGVNSFSATMVAGNAAAANADALVYDVMTAFYTACGSFIGQNYGAGKKDRVKKSYFVCLIYSFGAGILLGIMLVLLGKPFLALFTREADVASAGMYRLTIMGFSYGFSAFMDNTIAAARGLGKSFVPTIIVLMGSCAFRIVWIYTIFAFFGTIYSLYLLYIFSWSITAVAEMIYFRWIYRKQMAIFE